MPQTINISDQVLKKALLDTQEAFSNALKLAKGEGSPEGTPAAEETPGEATPGEAASPTDDTTAGPSAPPDASAAPDGAGSASAPPPDASASAGDPAAAQAVDPAALAAEYAKLPPEELMAHITAALSTASALGLDTSSLTAGAGAGAPPPPPGASASAGAPPMPPDASAAPPGAGMPPPPGASPAGAPPPPMPPMPPDASASPALKSDRLDAVQPTKGDSSKDRLAAIAPSKGGEGTDRLTAVQPAKKNTGAGEGLMSNNKGPMSGPPNGEDPTQKNAVELANLKKSLAEKDSQMAAQMEGVAKLVAIFTGKPLQKAVTGVSALPKPGTENTPAPADDLRKLSKSEVNERLCKAAEKSLSKDDRRKINQFALGHIGLDGVAHLLK